MDRTSNIVAGRKCVGVLWAKQPLPLFKDFTQDALDLLILSLIIKNPTNSKLHTRPFQRIAGTVSQLLGFAQMLERISVLDPLLGGPASKFVRLQSSFAALISHTVCSFVRLSILLPGFQAQFLGFVKLIQSRSEEHTSELQSQSNLVCRLLLEKKKK